MTKIINPFAFPFPDERDAEGNGISEGSPGMTLRDWFAGQALPDIIDVCRHDTMIREMGHEAYFAMKAYAMAGAMLAERAKGGEA